MKAPALIVPAFQCSQHLSEWAGIVEHGALATIGVECYVDEDRPDLFPAADGPDDPYLHVLVSTAWDVAECRAWALTRLAEQQVDASKVDDDFANFNDLVDEKLADLDDSSWIESGLILDDNLVAADRIDAIGGNDWAAHLEFDGVNVAMVGLNVPWARLTMRAATADEHASLFRQAAQR